MSTYVRSVVWSEQSEASSWSKPSTWGGAKIRVVHWLAIDRNGRISCARDFGRSAHLHFGWAFFAERASRVSIQVTLVADAHILDTAMSIRYQAWVWFV
jgi:hypothetical protein